MARGEAQDGIVSDPEAHGEELARTYCASCHLFPEPALLPQKSWQYALSYMGFFLGIMDYKELQESPEGVMESINLREELLRKAGMMPGSPLISLEDWDAIKSYYLSMAPLRPVGLMKKKEPLGAIGGFSLRRPQYSKELAITSMVYVDEVNRFVLVFDSRSEELTVLDRKLNFHDAHPSPGVSLVGADLRGREDLYLLSIGDLFASEIGGRYGELQQVKMMDGILFGLRVLLKGLHRPADFKLADMDGDGLDELLVSNFGEYTGNFSLYRRQGRLGAFDSEAMVLSEQPGIVKSEVYDFNGDGMLDILVLMSHARENVSLFLNRGTAGFERRILVEQHPAFGYTDLEIRDFNGDGRMDFLTVNGDNGDSDPYNTLKRDHGIRIYLNEGNLEFEESYFYPMYGAFGAEVEDFDLDGDLDIAAISYHPDFAAESPENFVYLEHVFDMKFNPLGHEATQKGRWLTIASGDFDGDGDKDLFLGAAYLPVGVQSEQMEEFEEMATNGPALLVLENMRGDGSL